MPFQAGTPMPVSTTTTGPVAAEAAQPVYVVSGGPVLPGPAQPVYVVTSGPVKGGAAIPVQAAVSGGPILPGPAMLVYVVGGSLGAGVITEATFSSGEIGSVVDTIVVVNWTAGIVSPGADYTLGVTIKVNGVAATISGAVRPSTIQTRYTLSAAVAGSDTITWEYSSVAGDLQTIATGNDVASISAQSITNNVCPGTTLDFSCAANSGHLATIAA